MDRHNNNDPAFKQQAKARFDPNTLQEGFTKNHTIIFMIVVSVVFLGFGVGLLYLGIVDDLRDMKILGPGCLTLGTIILLITIILLCRDQHKKRQIQKVRNKDDTSENVTRTNNVTYGNFEVVPEIPKEDIARQRTPSVVELYGNARGTPVRTTATPSGIDAEICDEMDALPSVAMPKLITDKHLDTSISVIQVPISASGADSESVT